MKIEHRVFITSTASVSCAGENNQILFNNIKRGISGIERDVNCFFDAEPALGKLSSTQSFNQELLQQCQNILDQSGLRDFKETLLIIGSSVGGIALTEEIFLREKNYKSIDPNFHHIQSIKNILDEQFEFYDDLSFSTACTSSANAIGYAHEVLSKGLYKNALVVGVDSLSKTTVGGFLSLGVLSSSISKPFDTHREGMNVAEAIACLLIETTPTPNAVEILGVGYSSDAYHMTHPHPEGLGALLAMRRALNSANIEAQEIDYINAHGTGTQANDSAESHAIATLFPHKPYVSSTKSITGHTLGASGALEAIISTLAIEQEMLPPNSFLENIENREVNFLLEPKALSINYLLSNSFAFGGNNCSLLLGRVR